jgi:hypothetical protein
VGGDLNLALSPREAWEGNAITDYQSLFFHISLKNIVWWTWNQCSWFLLGKNFELAMQPSKKN